METVCNNKNNNSTCCYDPNHNVQQPFLSDHTVSLRKAFIDCQQMMEQLSTTITTTTTKQLTFRFVKWQEQQKQQQKQKEQRNREADDFSNQQQQQQQRLNDDNIIDNTKDIDDDNKKDDNNQDDSLLESNHPFPRIVLGGGDDTQTIEYTTMMVGILPNLFDVTPFQFRNQYQRPNIPCLIQSMIQLKQRKKEKDIIQRKEEQSGIMEQQQHHYHQEQEHEQQSNEHEHEVNLLGGKRNLNPYFAYPDKEWVTQVQQRYCQCHKQEDTTTTTTSCCCCCTTGRCINRQWFLDHMGNETFVPVRYDPITLSTSSTLDSDGRATECQTKHMKLSQYIQYLNNEKNKIVDPSFTGIRCCCSSRAMNRAVGDDEQQQQYENNCLDKGDGDDNNCYYLKDWHLQLLLLSSSFSHNNSNEHNPIPRCVPSSFITMGNSYNSFYTVPEHFQDDLLNPFLLRYCQSTINPDPSILNHNHKNKNNEMEEPGFENEISCEHDSSSSTTIPPITTNTTTTITSRGQQQQPTKLTNLNDYRFVYWGPRGSKTTIHSDVMNTYSWSYNVHGTKLWNFYFPLPLEKGIIIEQNDEGERLVGKIDTPLLYPPSEFTKKMKPTAASTSTMEQQQQPYEQQINLKSRIVQLALGGPSYEVIPIIQRTGECMFVPSQLLHDVTNLEETISINHNWFTATNVNYVYECLCIEMDSIQNELLKWDGAIQSNDYEILENMLRGCFGLDVSTFILMILIRLLDVLLFILQHETTTTTDKNDRGDHDETDYASSKEKKVGHDREGGQYNVTSLNLEIYYDDVVSLAGMITMFIHDDNNNKRKIEIVPRLTATLASLEHATEVMNIMKQLEQLLLPINNN